jgi:hypothetical protein
MKTHIPQIIGAADTRRRRCRKQVAEDTQEYNGEVVFFQPQHFWHVLRCGAERQEKEEQQARTHQVAGPDTMEPTVAVALPQYEQQKTGQSVRAPYVNSLSLDKMLKAVVTVAQQIMTESNGDFLEEAKILTITNSV